MSIACWNKQNDIKNALALINYSLRITVSESDKSKFQQDKNELEKLKKKYKGVLVCHFCETNAPDDKYLVRRTIYGNINKNYFTNNIEYSYLNIKIPRCKSCKKVHTKGIIRNRMISILFVAITGLVFYLFDDLNAFLGMLIGWVVGWIIGNYYEGKFVRDKKVKNLTNKNLSKHPSIEDRMNSGWTFSKPSA